MNNGDHQTFRSECPTDLSKPYLPLDIFFKIKSKSLPKMQKQVDSSSDDDGDDDNDGKQFADDKLTLSRDTILEGEKLETLILAGELRQVEDNKAKELDDANEENVEDKPHEEDDQPQYHPRKKRKRKKKKTRKKGAKPPQPQDQQEKQIMSSEICTMTTRTKNAAPTPRPLSLPLSLSLPLPLRPLSLSPLRDGPLRDVPVKATTPEGMRSLHPITTLCVINENESIDDEPSNFDEVDAILTNDTQGNSETLTASTLSTLSSILNSNRDRNGNQNLNNCNNNIKFNNDNNNNSNTNDNNNNKNNHFKVIISDYDGEINGDYNLRENSFDEYADRSDRLLEFTNERSNNSWLGESSSFSSLYRLESFDDSHFNDGCESPGLEGVKAMANRLKLATRRPSYQQWCDRYIGSSGVPRFPDLSPEEEVDEKLTEERKDRINSALEWIKNELGEMRTIDHNLATQLLTLRNDIHRLKLERSCENHQDLLDDVKDELSERETLSAVSDIPYDMADDNPLKHLGVTRMNISSRRFSMC